MVHQQSSSADINLVRTNLEDHDSLMDSGLAEVSLRVHLYIIYDSIVGPIVQRVLVQPDRRMCLCTLLTK